MWDPLRAVLNRDDVICLSPPGFGAPVPDEWRATVEDYRGWLIGELEVFGPRWISWATTGVAHTW